MMEHQKIAQKGWVRGRNGYCCVSMRNSLVSLQRSAGLLVEVVEQAIYSGQHWSPRRACSLPDLGVP